jgi:hypothetical protein
MSIDAVRECVREECRRSIFGAAFCDEHLAVVAHYGRCLARRLGADPVAVELAGWLHDLAAVRDPAALPEHARLSAELAPDVLAGHGFDGAVVESVRRAIASHSSPLPMGGGTLEEVCLSQADAIAQIIRPAYWLYFAFTVRQLGFEQGREWVVNLWENRWQRLIEPARELVGGRYLMAREMLDTSEDFKRAAAACRV